MTEQENDDDRSNQSLIDSRLLLTTLIAAIATAFGAYLWNLHGETQNLRIEIVQLKIQITELKTAILDKCPSR
jgi:hypothetical protein